MSKNFLQIGKLLTQNSCLFLCDMQVKFRPSIKYFDEIVKNSNRLLRAAKILDMPVVVTEQYPKGLGKTVPELGIEEFGIQVVEKTKFSMCLDPIMTTLKSNVDLNTVILCGIETHVCIQQTALDLLSNGYRVFVVADACSSRGKVERALAYTLLQQSGCWLTSTESAILSLAGGSEHPKFKQLQALIKEEGPDTGLNGLLGIV